MFDCTWVFRRIFCYLDAVLSDAERRDLEDHLEVCAPCKALVRDEVDFLQALTGPGVRYSAPDQLREKVGTRLQAAESELPRSR